MADRTFDLEAWLSAAARTPPIVQAGAAVLRQRADDVPASLLGSPALFELVRVMVEVMRQAPGVGLAAPQIGVPLRVFVAEDPEARLSELPEDNRTSRGRIALGLTVLVNPSVSPEGEQRATFFEGCLSVRGYAALVPRWQNVVVTGLDAGGAPVSVQLSGWPARIMQHELDHLDGTLYVDRMLSRSFAAESEASQLSRMPVEDVLRNLGLSPHDR